MNAAVFGGEKIIRYRVFYTHQIARKPMQIKKSYLRKCRQTIAANLYREHRAVRHVSLNFNEGK